ncbi:hypothetical protein PoB_005813300 [Plakobranchus ocellatus]|uniref:Uncharacterized protein n=1 Tax=Plakobranchus ocellatus TaxID=259542 RepID=A0AAV4CI23_9GAST|nr:hypothetical protein PoB_005813300 [Plakobranchus ocellatus]
MVCPVSRGENKRMETEQKDCYGIMQNDLWCFDLDGNTDGLTGKSWLPLLVFALDRYDNYVVNDDGSSDEDVAAHDDARDDYEDKVDGGDDDDNDEIKG